MAKKKHIWETKENEEMQPSEEVKETEQVQKPDYDAVETIPYEPYIQPREIFEKKTGVVKLINVKKDYIVVEINGNGVRIPYSAELHKNIKINDTIDV